MRATLTMATAFLVFTLSLVPLASGMFIEYSFEDGTTPSLFDPGATSVASGFTASDMTANPGPLIDFPRVTGRAAGVQGFSNGARRAFEWTLTSEVGSLIDVGGVTFDDRATDTGPRDWELFLNDVLVASGQTTSSISFGPNGAVFDLPPSEWANKSTSRSSVLTTRTAEPPACGASTI